MAPPSFSILPPELLCRVFGAADDFSVVATLGRTSRIFYDVWRANSNHIYRAIAPRAFSNLADAEFLVDMQEEAEAPKQLQWQQHSSDGVKSRVKGLRSNARCASAACDHWESQCKIHLFDRRGEVPDMKPSRFERAFYRVWAVAVMAGEPHLHKRASEFLGACGTRELYELVEMYRWLGYFSDHDFEPMAVDRRKEMACYDFIFDLWTVRCK